MKWRRLAPGLYESADGQRFVARSAFADWYLTVEGVQAIYVFRTKRQAQAGVGGRRMDEQTAAEVRRAHANGRWPR